ncbi:putative type VI secretion system effector [Burkholderia sp. Ac-20353]|uniref:putative type VI secretion system effector n=1 Tax=Burkholderia sp. Ac-20353 TaxID=2703894 RepID=UPI0024029726|nr:putative type VI secretion system effector [Burkholderia sp. Ac-20353]
MQNQTTQAVLLRGRVQNLRRTKTTRDFMRTEADKVATGVGAVAIGLAGMTGLATAVAISAGNSNEEVDKVSFDIGDVHVDGWLWRCPFRENDEVEVVAEQSATGATCFAVRRVDDGLIAVYPHCTIGKRAYIGKSTRICLTILTLWAAAMAYAFFVKMPEQSLSYQLVFTGISVLFAALLLAFFAMSGYRKDRSFIAISERMFETFGWPDPATIDLKRTSKGKKREGDGPGYGLWIFRR